MGKPVRSCANCEAPTIGKLCRACYTKGPFKRTGPCIDCGVTVTAWYAGRRCMKCGGVARRRDPNTVRRDTPCIDCGKPTRGIRCNACWGASNTGTNNARWNGGQSAKRARRRMAETQAFVEYIGIAELAERDRDLCGICRKPVPATDRTIDHIVPLSRGGLHELANVQLAHRACNSGRGNRGSGQPRLRL